MPFTPRQLKEAIEGDLPESVAYVEDFKGTGDHFNVVVIAPDFEGRSRIERHRLVHRALREIIEGDLHALHLKTLTPEDAIKAGYDIA